MYNYYEGDTGFGGCAVALELEGAVEAVQAKGLLLLEDEMMEIDSYYAGDPNAPSTCIAYDSGEVDSLDEKWGKKTAELSPEALDQIKDVVEEVVNEEPVREADEAEQELGGSAVPDPDSDSPDEPSDETPDVERVESPASEEPEGEGFAVGDRVSVQDDIDGLINGEVVEVTEKGYKVLTDDGEEIEFKKEWVGPEGEPVKEAKVARIQLEPGEEIDYWTWADLVDEALAERGLDPQTVLIPVSLFEGLWDSLENEGHVFNFQLSEFLESFEMNGNLLNHEAKKTAAYQTYLGYDIEEITPGWFGIRSPEANDLGIAEYLDYADSYEEAVQKIDAMLAMASSPISLRKAALGVPCPSCGQYTVVPDDEGGPDIDDTASVDNPPLVCTNCGATLWESYGDFADETPDASSLVTSKKGMAVDLLVLALKGKYGESVGSTLEPFIEDYRMTSPADQEFLDGAWIAMMVYESGASSYDIQCLWEFLIELNDPEYEALKNAAGEYVKDPGAAEAIAQSRMEQ